MKNLTKLFTFTLIIMLLLLAKSYLSIYAAPMSYGWGGILNQTSKIDKLFIGSSHTRQSYDMKIIEKECNCNPYLFAYSGMGPSLIYITLKHLIEKLKIKPSQVIIEAYPFKVLFKPQMHDDRFFQFAPFDVKLETIDLLNKHRGRELLFSEYIRLFLTGRNETLLLSFLTNNIINNYSYKGSYQNKFMSPVSLDEYNQFPKNLSKIGNKKETLPFILKQYGNIAKLLRDNNIDLVFIDPPLPANIRHQKITVKIENILKESLLPWKAKYLTPWKYKRGINNNHQNFNDWNHLSSRGRSIYSKDVANLLKKML